MSAATKGSFSEDEFGKRMDRCLTDVLIKSTNGFALGTILSVLFFRQRRWPIILAGGIGAGLAFSKCETHLSGIPTEEKKKETYF